MNIRKILTVISLCVICVSAVWTDDSPKPTEEHIKDLIKQLGAEDWQKREEAQKTLEEIGSSAEAALKEAAKGADPEVRMRANAILSVIIVKRLNFSATFLKEFPGIYQDLLKLDAPGKFAILAKVTTQDNLGFQYKDKVTNQDITKLIGEILSDGGVGLTADQKQGVVWCCGVNSQGSYIPGWHTLVPEAVPYIMRLLNDKNEDVCSYTIRALGTLEAKEAIPGITKLLKSGSFFVRWAAVEVLGKLDAKGAVPEIIPLLKDKEPDACCSAALTLGKLGAKEAIPEIRKLLQGDYRARRGAITALGQLGDKEMIPELIKALNDHDVCPEAVGALGALGSKESVPEIIKVLQSKNGDELIKAMEVLTLFNAKEAVPGIIRHLQHRKIEVRCSVVEALGKLGGKELIGEISKALEDENYTVRGLAAIVMVELGMKDKIPPKIIDDLKGLQKYDTNYKQRAQAALKELGAEIEEKKKE